MTTTVQALLLEIARCPIASACLQTQDTAHPCHELVRSQGARGLSDFQVPEPWSGQIDRAKLLFISSNPGISKSDKKSKQEEYPTGSWPDTHIVDFFVNRFGGGRKEWVANGTHALHEDGSRARRGTAFWKAVRARANEVLGREAVPGLDYALTEVVRCKSVSEASLVERARIECSPRYLESTVAISVASVLVVLGDHAKRMVCTEFELEPDQIVQGPVDLGQRQRMVVFLPHPNAHKVRTFAGLVRQGVLQATELDHLRAFALRAES
ncbi:MAG TPA: uracil-DNA glycosylase family protein [Dehalococcoidia bacterium]|nr:uracil-DNA glycosylase family protein [Dehalococcoidia bacterium]